MGRGRGGRCLEAFRLSHVFYNNGGCDAADCCTPVVTKFRYICICCNGTNVTYRKGDYFEGLKRFCDKYLLVLLQRNSEYFTLVVMCAFVWY